MFNRFDCFAEQMVFKNLILKKINNTAAACGTMTGNNCEVEPICIRHTVRQMFFFLFYPRGGRGVQPLKPRPSHAPARVYYDRDAAVKSYGRR